MRIVVVNRNYFITGGPEQYWFRLQQYMPDCEFIPFCVNFAESLDSPYRKYWPDPPGNSGVYFKDFRMSPWQKARYALDNVYSLDARRRLERLLRDVRPDVAYFLNAVYFTDSIVDACRAVGVPVVWRMSDFHKVCASYHLLRDGQVCEACLTGGLSQALRYRCGGYQRSLGAAMVKVTGMGVSRWRDLYRHVRYLVTPSEFTRSRLLAGGFPAEQVVHLPTFVDVPQVNRAASPPGRDILYVGRLNEEKGIEVLLQAFQRLADADVSLYIVGDGAPDYVQALQARIVPAWRERVHFLGFCGRERITSLFQRCAFFVVPSVCYENLPNVVLEGMAQGRAGVVSRLGSLAEVVQHGVTGMQFEAGNVQSLADSMTELLNDPGHCVRMGQRAREFVIAHHDPVGHVARLRVLLSNA